MAEPTASEILVVVNTILNGLVTRPDGGSWGVPSDFSVLVRQDQPDGSGGSKFKTETVQMPQNTMIIRQTSDIVALPFSDIIANLGVSKEVHVDMAHNASGQSF